MAVEMGGGGRTLSERHKSVMKLLLRSRKSLESVESSSIDSPDLSSVKKDISQIHSLCTEMDLLCRSIAVKSQRDIWKRWIEEKIYALKWCRKVEQVAEESESLNQSLDKCFLRNPRRMMEAKERAELLERANGEPAHVLTIFDEEAQAMQAVQDSSRLLEDATATGETILIKYSEQRERLKRAQRKTLDVLNTVGLSNSALKLIERRHRVDKWMVCRDDIDCCCCCVVLLEVDTVTTNLIRKTVFFFLLPVINS